MGAYGTPEHLPGESPEPQYQYGYQNPNSKNIIHGKLKTWQKVLLIVYLCLSGLFAIIMLVGLASYTGNMAIGIISAIAFIVLAILFSVRANARKIAWPFVACSMIAFVVYFGAMGSSETSRPPTVPTDNAAAAVVTSNAVSSKRQESNSATSNPISKAPTVSADPVAQYKKGCTTFAYKEIARNPNNYKGKQAKFTGQVIQVQESWGTNVIRLNVTKGDYGSWSDTIYVEYKPKSENESRILENDIITAYGELNGIKTYTTVLMSDVSVPYLIAQYVDINPETGSITKAKYDQLKTGMAYEKVKSIIGSDGKVLSEYGEKGKSDYTATYEWDGDNAGEMAMIVFQGNKLQSKNQTGLK